MPLSPGNADLLANAICAAMSPPITDSAAKDKWKAVCETIYSHLLTDIGATLPPGSVVTVGSPTTQTGPAAPVTILIS